MRRSIYFAVVGATALAVFIASVESNADSTPGFNNVIPDQILTPDKVETRIGDLKVFDGVPDKATVDKVYDQLDSRMHNVGSTRIREEALSKRRVGCGSSH